MMQHGFQRQQLYTRYLIGMGMIAFAVLMMIDPAFAQTSTGATSFRCSGGHAVGQLFDSNVGCPTTLGMNNLFTFLICNMEQLVSNLMGEMYCSIVTDLIPAVMGMLTLAVLFFGISFTVGLIPATAKDFQAFLIKIVFVFVFATQSDYLIGVGYNLLITSLREGVAIGLSAMMPPKPGGGSVSGLDMYRYLDGFLAQAMHFATDYVGGKWDTPGSNPCKNAVFAVMAIMAIAFPPVFYIGVMIIFRVALTFLRAIFGYMYSLVGIVFLLTLAPFFVSFFLFRATRPFFDKWIGYLVSFTLQMVILFAFLAFVLSIDVSHISSSLTNIIVPNKEVVETTALRAPWNYCTICQFQVVNKETKEVLPDYGASDLISNGELQCTNAERTPISVTDLSAPEKQKVTNALIKFASTGLLSLLVLAYLVEYILNYVPALSSFLAGSLGAAWAPQLGGGATIGQKASLDIPGGELVTTFERGFDRGFNEQTKAGKSSISGAMEGFKQGAASMVAGGPRRSDGTTTDPGMVDSFTHFILNPHRDPNIH